jgi:hypothetical protein
MSNKNTDTITHPLLQIIPCTKDLFHIYLNAGIEFSDSLYDKIDELFKEGLGTKQKPIKCNTLQLNKIITDLNKCLEEFDPNSDDSDYDSDDEEETIQQVLARRLKSESKQEIIDEETIENSEDEDTITSSRRIRYLLKSIKLLKDEIHNLKQSKI